MARKTYGGLNKDQLVDYFQSCKKECEDSLIDIRKMQDKSLEQYMCRKDFGNKKKWQAQCYVPIGKPTIKKAVRMIKKAMLDAENYFDFETYGIQEQKKKQCDITKRTVKCHLNKGGFVNKFSDSLESGFTLALMILKFWVKNVPRHWTIDASINELVTSTLPELQIKVINPYNFSFTMDKTIQIEDEWIKFPQLQDLAKSNGGPFDDKAIKHMAMGDYYTENRPKDDEDRLRRLGITDSLNKYRKDVLLSHFWGPTIDIKGNVREENRHFVMGNEKYILLEPEKNPFWHKESPYVFDSPLPMLFRHIGKTLIEDVAGLEDAIIGFIHAQIDNLKWIMLGVNEVDKMAFSEIGKTQLKELYPGKMVEKRTGYQGDAFKHHEIGTEPEKAMALLKELQIFYERDTSITEYVTSLPATRGETLGEYQGKRSAAVDDFVSIAKDIETRFFVKCIDRARDLTVQYMSEFNDYPEIAAIFEGEQLSLDNLSDAQKKQMIITDLDIVGRGISVFFDRQERLNKLGSYVKFLNAMPDDAKEYPKWEEILMRINDAFAFDRKESMLRTKEEVQVSRQQKMTQMQQAVVQQLQMQQMEWQHEKEKWLLDFRQAILKLLQDSEEKGQDRLLQLLLAGIEDIRAKRELMEDKWTTQKE